MYFVAFLCFQWHTSVPDGMAEELGKEAYNERLNQRRRNTEQHRSGVKAVENVK